MGNVKIVKARTRSVENLQRLYVIVISLSIVYGLKCLFEEIIGERGLVNFVEYRDQLFMFVSFIFTAVPFFHGSMRYLDQTYIIDTVKTKRCALMIDFIALFVQGLMLFALSTMIGQMKVFYNALIVLLVFDIIWVGSTNLTNNKQRVDEEKGKQKTKHSFKKWAVLNAITIWAILISVWSTLWSTDTIKSTMLVLIVVYRTILDYLLVWDWYYPEIPAPPPARPFEPGQGFGDQGLCEIGSEPSQ